MSEDVIEITISRSAEAHADWSRGYAKCLESLRDEFSRRSASIDKCLADGLIEDAAMRDLATHEAILYQAMAIDLDRALKAPPLGWFGEYRAEEHMHPEDDGDLL